MQTQIQELLRRERLSSSQFADKIGIQRSSVSHVLSGRNKPGFDFIQKILKAFPEINGDWLITGSGDMYKQKTSSGELFESLETSESPTINEKTIKSPVGDVGPEKVKRDLKDSEKRQIERVIVFYTDKTFREYDAEP